MKKAVFLDRDGVINRVKLIKGKPYPPEDVGELEILPGVESALMSLKKAGYYLVIVTNQPDVARGVTSLGKVEEINSTLAALLPIDEFRTCFHDDLDGCDCRKPKPGAILAAAREHNIDLTKSFMVGDRWKDITAGHDAGCRTIFINYDYNEAQPENPDFQVESLMQSVKIILNG